MKNILIIFFIATILNAQALQLIYGGETPKWAIDVATDEYGYDNSVTGLDLNGSELITNSYDRDMTDTFSDDFTSDITGWTGTGSTVFWYNSDQNSVGRVNCLLDSATGATAKATISVSLTAGIRYRISYRYYIPSTNITTKKIRTRLLNGSTPYLDTQSTLDSWTLAEQYYTPTENYTLLWIYQAAINESVGNATVGDKIYIDDVIITPTNWTGAAFSNNAMTFTSTASLTNSNFTHFVSGHNYTIQGDFKSAGVLESELANSLTWSNGSSDIYETFTTSGKNITSAVNTTGSARAITSYNIAVIIGEVYEISLNLTLNSGQAPSGVRLRDGEGGNDYNAVNQTLSNGHNVWQVTITRTGNCGLFIYNNAASNFSISNLSIKKVNYSSFKFVTDNDSSTVTTTGTSATKAFTFTYSGGSQTVQLKGVGTDTWTADNISITEAYDLEIEGYFKANNIATTQYILSTSGGDNIRLGLSSSKLYFRPDNSQSSSYVYSSTLSSNTWYKYKVNYSGLTRVANCYINGVLDNGTQSTASTWLNKEAQTSLHIGLMSTTYFSGIIGETKFTRKDGTGAVVSTSIYDWKGTSATFLNDKGTNGNHLTGVNTTTADQVKYSTGKYK